MRVRSIKVPMDRSAHRQRAEPSMSLSGNLTQLHVTLGLLTGVDMRLNLRNRLSRLDPLLFLPRLYNKVVQNDKYTAAN
jgi:hypothetical protein